MAIYNIPLKNINIAETKRYAGLGKTEFNEQELADACLATQLLAKPMGTWEIYDYDNITGKIISSPNYFITGKSIITYLHKAQKVVIFAATIGENVDQAITNTFNEGNYSRAFLMDAAATAAVEDVLNAMEKTFAPALQNSGYNLLARYSPGYGDWDIHFQPQMLLLSQAAKINLRLTDSYMLIPRKSVTAIIGLVPNSEPNDNTCNSCNICSQKNCYARKETEK